MLQFLNAVIQERTCLPKPIYFTAFLLSKYTLQPPLAKIEHYFPGCTWQLMTCHILCQVNELRYLLHEMLQFLNAVIQERTCLPKPIYFTAFLLSKYTLQALLAKIEHYHRVLNVQVREITG